MIARSLKIRGFRSYENADLELPPGAVAIVGRDTTTGLSNGAGKSTIMHAIEACLFGTSGDRDGRIKFSDQVNRDSLTGVVELELDHRGRRYRVRRSYTRSGSRGKPGLDFEIAGYDVDELRAGIAIAQQGIDPGDFHEKWQPLTQGSIDATQTLIEQTLAISKATWRASVYLAQNDPASFPAADRIERRRLLQTALGLDRYATAADLVKTDRQEAERTVNELAGRISVLEEEQPEEGLDESLADAVAALSAAEPALADATSDHHRLTDLRDRAREATVIHRERLLKASMLEQELTQARQQRSAAYRAREELVAYERELERVADAEMAMETAQQQLAGARDQQRLRDEAEARLAFLRAELKRAEAEIAQRDEEREGIDRRREEIVDVPKPVCDRCGQAMDTDARERALAQIDEERAGAQRRHVDAQERALEARRAITDVDLPAPPDPETVAALEERVQQLRTVTARKNDLTVSITLAQTKIAAAPTDEQIAQQEAAATEAQELANTPPDPAWTDSDGQQLQHATQQIAELTRQTADLRARQQVLQEKIARRDERASALQAATEQRAAAAERLEVLQVLERAFGPAGVPAWIVEHNAIPAIETFANHVLAELGGAVSRVSLRTQRETKSGKQADTLDVVCLTTDGSEQDFTAFSGGEQTRVDIALRLGLARLLAARANADLRVMMLDEPSGLDQTGMEALVRVVRELADTGGFETVLLASHQPELRDVFDQSIVVTKTDGVSEAVVA